MTPNAAPRAAASSPDVVQTFDFARAYAICAEKSRRNLIRLADRPISGAFAADGNYFAFPEGFFDIGNWTSSFFTGMALLHFSVTRELELLKHANRLGDVYRDKVTRERTTTMHDLGFLYSLYSVALHQLTGELGHKRTALLAADELAKRYHARGRYIRAWGPMNERGTDYDGLAIIDCMMNLPLLFWASRETGSRFYDEIAFQHAATTLQNFVRVDDSVCHAFRFDLRTGVPASPANYCGYATDSHWARGTAWAIYGFALAYRHTRHEEFLGASQRLARKFSLALDAEIVPPWDFRLPPGEIPLRDSSAAAIAICGIDELTAHRPDPGLTATADALLRRLCAEEYLDANPECPGVLRNAEVGDGPGKAPGTIKGQNVYASWGDYFFMEALSRRLHGVAAWW